MFQFETCESNEDIMICKDTLDNLPPSLNKDLDRNLCTCNGVLKRDIIHAIVNGATTVEEIQKQTYATLGIGCCRQQIERLIESLYSPDDVR